MDSEHYCPLPPQLTSRTPDPEALCLHPKWKPEDTDGLSQASWEPYAPSGVRTDKVAWNLASRLYHLEGFRKSEVAAYLRKK